MLRDVCRWKREALPLTGSGSSGWNDRYGIRKFDRVDDGSRFVLDIDTLVQPDVPGLGIGANDRSSFEESGFCNRGNAFQLPSFLVDQDVDAVAQVKKIKRHIGSHVRWEREALSGEARGQLDGEANVAEKRSEQKQT